MRSILLSAAFSLAHRPACDYKTRAQIQRGTSEGAMNLILVKMFATALALAQVTTRPDQLKTEFDPIADQPAVVQILKDGCAHMRKAFDIEDLNLDSLIDTAMTDPQTIAGEIRAFRGINFDDLLIAYK